MPPPAIPFGATAPVAVAAAAPAAIGIGSVAAVSAPAGAAVAGSGNVSLKDIARTAAREAERELILRMLTRTRWNRKEAAEILGISYKALLYKIKENGLDKAS
jgi:DNA-binding NtrC family response regulator